MGGLVKEASPSSGPMKEAAMQAQFDLYADLLQTRMALQPALQSLNALPPVEGGTLSAYLRNKDSLYAPRAKEALVDAKISLRHVLKRCFVLQSSLLRQPLDYPTVSMESDEAYLDAMETALANKEETLKTWREKVIPVVENSVVSAPTTASTKPQFKALQQPLFAQVDHLLADRQRLVKRTQKRRNAELNYLGRATKRRALNTEEEEDVDPAIFDDTDFYQAQLKDLIEVKLAAARAAPENGKESESQLLHGLAQDSVALTMRWAEFREQQRLLKKKRAKQVDTKASKGRRLRYDVHDKLVAFMAPRKVNTWHPEKINELFASLLTGEVQHDEETALPQNTKHSVEGIRLFS